MPIRKVVTKAMKFNDTLMKLVDANIKSKSIPMLIGEPGIGKSSWVIDLGKRNGTQVFVLPCNQLADKTDLTGCRLVPVPGSKDDYVQKFYPHEIIVQAINYAEEHPDENPILFMDELNRTTPDVTSECLSIPTLRSIGNRNLPENLRVVTAGNDKGNITSLDEASISRFVLYHVEPDVDTFMAVNPDLNKYIKATLTKHPETIFCKTKQIIGVGAQQDDDSDDNNADVDMNEILDDAESMNQITTPRTITGLSNFLNAFSDADLITFLTDVTNVDGIEKSTLQEAIEGHVGATAFAIFLLSEITTGVSTGNGASSRVTVTKPLSFATLKKCATAIDVDDTISNMSEADRSACLVYALYEREDNALYIEKLAKSLTTLTPGDMTLIMKLIVSSDLNIKNIDTFASVQCPLTMTLEPVLQAMPRDN